MYWMVPSPQLTEPSLLRWAYWTPALPFWFPNKKFIKKRMPCSCFRWQCRTSFFNVVSHCYQDCKIRGHYQWSTLTGLCLTCIHLFVQGLVDIMLLCCYKLFYTYLKAILNISASSCINFRPITSGDRDWIAIVTTGATGCNAIARWDTNKFLLKTKTLLLNCVETHI